MEHVFIQRAEHMGLQGGMKINIYMREREREKEKERERERERGNGRDKNIMMVDLP